MHTVHTVHTIMGEMEEYQDRLGCIQHSGGPQFDCLGLSLLGPFDPSGTNRLRNCLSKFSSSDTISSSRLKLFLLGFKNFCFQKCSSKIVQIEKIL